MPSYTCQHSIYSFYCVITTYIIFIYIYSLFSAEAAKRTLKILKDQFRVELKKVAFGKSGDPSQRGLISIWCFFFFCLIAWVDAKQWKFVFSSCKHQIISFGSWTYPNSQHSGAISGDLLDLAYEQNITLDIPPHASDQLQSFTIESSISYSRAQPPNESCYSRSRSQSPTGPPTKK